MSIFIAISFIVFHLQMTLMINYILVYRLIYQNYLYNNF
jgi:hypothetical protein